MISTAKCCANASASAVLPLAVGPSSTKAAGSGEASFMRKTFQNSESETVHAAARKRRSGFFAPKSQKRRKLSKISILAFCDVVKNGFCHHPVNIFEQEHSQ